MGLKAVSRSRLYTPTRPSPSSGALRAHFRYATSTHQPRHYVSVGQVFFGDGRPRMPDITDFLITTKAPPECRGQPTWENG
eukprot:scaffold48120_cov69-Phaeocystis_antarctica.AAC.1